MWGGGGGGGGSTNLGNREIKLPGRSLTVQDRLHEWPATCWFGMGPGPDTGWSPLEGTTFPTRLWSRG